MFTLSQTYEGLKVTVHYFIELAKFLIMQKVSHLLTESFFQDLLGNYFGKKRSFGVRNITHPSRILIIMRILSETKRYSSQYQQGM